MARVVGLDIGARQVRAIAVTRGKAGWTLAGHAAVPRRDDQGGERPLAVVLAELDTVLRLRGARVTVAKRDLSTLIRFVATAPMAPDRLQKLLRLELAQHLEGEVELAADAFVVPIGGDELVHCCVVAQPPQIYELNAELKRVGIAAQRVHHVGAALGNATLPGPPIEGDELALLVDLDADASQIALIGERRMLACRQIGLGADAFAEARARARGDQLRTATGRLRRDEARARDAAVGRPKPGVVAPPAAAAAPPPAALGSGVIDAGELFASPSAAPPRAATASTDSELSFDESDELRLDDATAQRLADAVLPATGPAAPPLSATETATSSDLFVPTFAPPAAGEGSEHEHYIIDIDHGDPSPRGTPTATPVADLTLDEPGDDQPAEAFGPELQRIGEQFYSQVVSSLAWFRAQLRSQGRLEPAKVLLTGLIDTVPGLAEYLAGRFTQPVEIYDATAAFAGPQPIDGVEWTGALGLALADAPGAVAIDLSPDALQIKRAWRDRLLWPFAAAAALLVAVGFIASVWMRDATADDESLANYKAYAKRWDEMKAQLDRLHADKEAMSDDLRAIASRIYAGRDLLYAVRALKEEAPAHEQLWVTRFETVGVGQDDPEDLLAVSDSARKGKAARPAVVDTTIARGAINITGFVKFDSSKTGTDLNKFFDDYRLDLDKWTFVADEEGKEVKLALFDAGKTNVRDSVMHLDEQPEEHVVKGKRGRQVTVKKGEFFFKLQMVFQPTRLAQVVGHETAAAAEGGG